MKTTRVDNRWNRWARGGREYRGSIALDGVKRPDKKNVDWTVRDQLLCLFESVASQFATQYPHGHPDVRNRPLRAFAPVFDKDGDLGCLYLTASPAGLSVKTAGRGAKEIVKFDTASMMRLLYELGGKAHKIPRLKDVHETLADMVPDTASILRAMHRTSTAS